MAVIRFEVWTRPESGTFERKFPLKDIVNWSLGLGMFGQGKISIPSSNSERLNDILFVDPSNHSNDKASMIRAFYGETWLYDFYAVRMPINVGEKGLRTSVVSGGGPGTALDRVYVRQFDYDRNPSVQPNWSYGGANANLSNPSFEDGVVNEGFEDQDIGSWKTLTGSDPWGDAFIDLDTDISTSTDEANTGSYSLKIPFSEAPSGISRTISVVPGERIQISYKFKEPTGSGDRYVIYADVDDGTIHHTNGWIFNGFAFAELDADVRQAGGSDGTWQDFDLDVTVGSEQTSLTLGVQCAAPPAGTPNKPTGYLDDGVFTGLGLGMAPWMPHNPITVMELESVIVLDGDWSAKVTGGDEGSIYQDINNMTPNVQYTVTFMVRQDSGVAKNIQAQHTIPGNNDAFTATITSVPSGIWTEVSHTWTETQATGRVEIKNKSGGVITFYVDKCSVSDGLPPAFYGKIKNDLLDDAGNLPPDRTALLWLVRTWTDLLDSASNAWDKTVSFSINRGQPYRRIATFHGEKHGYEHSIHPNSSDISIIEYDIFNPNGLGTDFTTGDGGAITMAGVINVGPILRREPLATYGMVEGDGQYWGESTNAVLKAMWGEIETYSGSDEQLVGSLTDLADNLVTGIDSETVIITFQNPPLIPGIDYKIGDIKWLNLGEDILPAAAYRVVSIDIESGDPEPTYQVQFVSEGL